MNILEELIAGLPADAEVRSILVGAHCTLVCSRHCGLVSTLSGDGPHSQERVRDAGRLLSKSARELAEYALSDNPLEASIGVAALNSMLEPPPEEETAEANAFEVIVQKGKGKKVALVGHFPFVPELDSRVSRLWVLERRPAPGDYPASAAPELIPQADVVAITGSALINHTLDDLLALCRRDACVVILGPSTPLSPVLYARGATVLCGARVVDQAAALRSVGQGATFQQVEGVKLLTWAID